MHENWYSIKEFNDSNIEEINAEIVTDGGSPWYSGHFPGNPILPGIAQISFIYDLIFKSIGIENKDFSISGIKKVRFRKIIKPDDLLKIEIQKLKNKNSYSFKLFTDEEIACSGTLLF